MKVEGDIVGFVLPFAAGVTAGVLSAHFHEPVSSGMIMTASLLPPLYLTHPSRRRLDGRITIIIIAISAFLCGMVTGITGSHISVSEISGFAESKAILLGMSMQGAIDSIPFTSDGTGAIIKALLTGERSDIPHHVAEAFRASGASHILALSGLHLGIIYSIIRKILTPIGNSPAALRIRSCIVILSCGIYTMATGAGPSIARAFLFILLGETSALSGRSRSTGTILMGAMLIQLTVSPESIRSAGFQLSYAAMAGIAYLYPRIRNLWPGAEKDGIIGWIWNSASLSIACQVATGPIAWLWFRTFPQHFLLTNLLAIPLAGIIIPVSLSTLILNTFGICPDIMIKATEALVNMLSAALEIISTM